MAVLQLLVVGCLAAGVMGHGYLLQPPSRSSAWRLGWPTPANYDDNALYCGGFNRQWRVNGGKCGICGDPWDGPRPNEAGGKFATGTITASYTQGQVVGVEVKITAHHKGWFEFRLCPNNDVNSRATQECLDRYLLPLADGSGTRFPLPEKARDVKVDLRLPQGLTCSQCVLQWKYNAGNNWGTDADTGESGIGLGNQEQFYGCADVKIEAVVGGEEGSAPVTPSTTSNSGSQSSTPKPATPSTTPKSTHTPVQCWASPKFESNPGMAGWCQRNCPLGNCPRTHCRCEGDPEPTGISGGDDANTPATPSSTPKPATPSTTPTATPSPSTRRASRPSPSSKAPVQCWASLDHESNPGMAGWCQRNCELGNCPRTHCRCEGDPEPTEICRAIGAFENQPGMDKWCSRNCKAGYCPGTHCKCRITAGTTTTVTFLPEGDADVEESGEDEGAVSSGSQPGADDSGRLTSLDSCTTFVAVAEFAGDSAMDAFCQKSCSFGRCSERFCACATGPEAADESMRCEPRDKYRDVTNFADYCQSCGSTMCDGCVCRMPQN